ncbi:MAG: glutaredoxin [Pseudomonadota bacterium]|nr:glutaredoxin [Pseudomonadota bacterium]
MKWLIRYFFKGLRALLGPIMLLTDKLTAPRGIQRSQQEQQQVDEQTRKLALYQFRTCPFCIKVRRAAKRLSLNIEKRDALKNPEHRQELLEGGGEIKVPCLRISEDDGQVRWLYESDDIIDYLQQRFA